jgi:hypothetical protein
MSLDPDTHPPVLSTRPDCGKPTGCVCQADEPCQFPLLMSQIPAPREDVEMPEQGI